MSKLNTPVLGETNIQKNLFERIRQQLASHLSLVEEVAETLHISTDSAYRRLRCETPVTLEEAAILCSHFKIAIDEIIAPPEEVVTFHRFSVNEESLRFAEYLKFSFQYFEKLKNSKNGQCIYAAKDIPVFYYFMFPQLACFKLYFWLKTIKGIPEFKFTSFSYDIVPEQYMKLSYMVAKNYFATSGIEIWNEETTNSTLRQINYYYEAGLFADNSVPLFLLDQLEQLIRHVHMQAEAGTKFFDATLPPGSVSYELYYNEVLLLDNTILTKSDTVCSVLVNYNAIDYLTTTNTVFFKEVFRWIQIQMEKSTLISKSSEKERNRFFNRIYESIKKLKKKIES